jgi:hypothetical protein
METEFQQMKSVLDRDNAKLRILMVDPEIVGKILDSEKALPTEQRAKENAGSLDIGKLWGLKEELEDLKRDTERTINTLKKFVDAELSGDHKRRLDVRLATTLLPFGAYAANPDKPWGKMAIKLLPVGAMGDTYKAAFQLNRRSDDLLYDYYLQYLGRLLRYARPIMGEMKYNEDLELFDALHTP